MIILENLENKKKEKSKIMEEQNRYKVKRLNYSLNVKLTDSYEPDWRYIIFDDVNDAELDKLETVVDLLNQQDKKIHILNEQSQNNYEKYTQVLKENQQLRQSQKQLAIKELEELQKEFDYCPYSGDTIYVAEVYYKIFAKIQELGGGENVKN